MVGREGVLVEGYFAVFVVEIWVCLVDTERRYPSEMQREVSEHA